MNFQSLPFIEDPQVFLDKALSQAKKRADILLQTRGKASDLILFQNKVAHEKITKVKDSLTHDLERIIDAYPDFSGLPEFYEQLLKTQVDIDELKIALGRVQGVVTQIQAIAGETQHAIRQSYQTGFAQKAVKSYYGRIGSLIKKLQSPLKLIEQTRRILVTFPDIKELFTVALAGFPNVGKSTLLSKVTPSKPKIANYAFTTKTLNIGYLDGMYDKIQMIDTPGTLARLDKMNAVEQQAYFCLKYEADLIIMVIDPSETYSLEDQEKLLDQIREHDKPIKIFISKTDLITEERTDELKGQYDAFSTLEELKEYVIQAARRY